MTQRNRPKSRRDQLEGGRRGNAGMTLLEVIVALTILGFGMLAMTAAQVAAMQVSESSRSRSEAHYLAEQQMELFQGMTRTGIEAARTAATYPNDAANPIDPDPQDGRAAAFNRSWTITPDVPETDVYTITVVVTWMNGDGQAGNVTLEGWKSEF